MNHYDELSPELRELFNSTPVLTDSDLKELADANRALARDPEFIADYIKGMFVNDILTAMDEQGVNKNQLAAKWGKSRQHIGQILDKEKSKNFTIDTIVSLSMTLGLIPQQIQFKKMAEEYMQTWLRIVPSQSELETEISAKWCEPEKCKCAENYVAERPPTEGYGTKGPEENPNREAA